MKHALVAATRPFDAASGWHQRSPSSLVESYVELGASPRATICWGRLVKVWALLQRKRAIVLPEDVQDLARYVLGHRVWLAPQAASQKITVEAVIDDVIASVAVP